MNFRLPLLFAALGLASAGAQPSRIEQLESAVQKLSAELAELKRQSASDVAIPPEAFAQQHQLTLAMRQALNDHQEAAARLSAYTVDRRFSGFLRVPNTPVLLKLNVKPHVDLTVDEGNTGNKYRFVTAKIPVEGAVDHGGGTQSNLNANATQLRFEARAPGQPGDFRFYYQNDFFGDNGADMRYRLQHLYGQYYNVVAGFTYGVFEDPDVWPDTVDYEGPNALIFSRRPVVHYKVPLGPDLHATFGLEKPDIYLDTSVDPAARLHTRYPDAGFNLRWEPKDLGHLQFSGQVREIGVDGPLVGDQDEFGWGVNLSGSLNLGQDTLLGLAVYGTGVGGMGNDASFVASDAAFTSARGLEALDYWSGLVGYTHRWSPAWRSTATFGYVQLDNASGQSPDAYHCTYYASANLVWQLRERLSVGFEGLWGKRVVKSGARGDVFRLQTGLVYSIFD